MIYQLARVVVRNSRGNRTSARVVAQLITGDGVYTYGVEFLDEPNRLKDFWGIRFPLSSRVEQPQF